MKTVAAAILVLGLLLGSAAGGDDSAPKERSVSELVKALKKGNDDARIGAAREIGERGIKAGRVASELRRLMLTADGAVLLAVAEALERTGAKMTKTVEKLAARLNAANADDRARAAWALGLVPSAKDLSPAIRKLLEEESDWVRVSAAAALLRFEHSVEPVTEILITGIGHDEERVRVRAVRGLRHHPGVHAQAIEALKGIVGEKGPEGDAACDTLAALGPRAKGALPALVKRVKSDELSFAVRAVPAIGAMGAAAVAHVPDLLRAVRFLDEKGLPACFAVAAMGAPAVPALVDGLEDPDVDVQIAAAVAVGKIGRDAAPAVPALIPLLPHPNHLVFDKQQVLLGGLVFTALGSIGRGAAAALPALQELAKPGLGSLYEHVAKATIMEIESDMGR